MGYFKPCKNGAYKKCTRCGKFFLIEKHKSRAGCSKCVKEISEGKAWDMSKNKWNRFELLDL